MPRKFVLRWLPDPQKMSQHRGLKWLGPAIQDPYLFHINRKSISHSFFIGLFCAYLPFPGQTLIAALLALKFRANLALAMALIWITNPITIAPMFFLSFKLGAWMLGTDVNASEVIISWDWISQQGSNILAPLIVGSLCCGLTLGLISYLIIRRLWRWKVIEKWEHRAKLRKAAAANPDSTPPQAE